MPGFDQTGPRGDGPMSGKAQGMCRAARSGRMQKEFDGCGQGRGRGRGRGFRCGMGNRFGHRVGIGPQTPQPCEDEQQE
ncbi:MAG: DUF5320 domain-containing protein [Desulfofustis sp.]|nr:DUF5320 domain-containing protein [Desulfofustis sp.]